MKNRQPSKSYGQSTQEEEGRWEQKREDGSRRGKMGAGEGRIESAKKNTNGGTAVKERKEGCSNL